MGSLLGIIEGVRRLRRSTVVVAVGVAVAAVLVFAVAAKAIPQYDATARFNNYIRGRCGNVAWRCVWLVSFGCGRVGNQPGQAQWTCVGDVGEKLRVFGSVDRGYLLRNFSTSRTCEVIASYAPNGARVYGNKTCGIIPG